MTDYKPNPDLDLVLERTVSVAPERVWAAWTEPELLKQWFTPAPWKTVDGREVVTGLPALEVLIRGVFDPLRFLDIVQNFVLFSDEAIGLVKRVAKYHQYWAVNAAVESTVTGSARKPSSATRTVARPSPRGWSVKRPSPSVSADVVAAAPDETKTLAPGTGRPASSTTRPVMGAAASARAEARIRNVESTRN